MKRCTKCGERKSFADFYVSRQGKRGPILMGRCKACDHERQRGVKRARAEYHRRYRREVLYVDPERRAIVNEQQRRRRQSKSPGRAATTLAPTVPVAPFAAWLRGATAGHPQGILGVAEMAGIQERILRRILNGEQDNVSIDTVERVLLAEGTADIDDLYPLAA